MMTPPTDARPDPPRSLPHRRLRFVPPGEPIRCVHDDTGHRIRENTFILVEHVALRCTARIPQRGRGQSAPPECGLLLYVLEMPGGWKLVAEVTLLEIRHMQQQRMDARQALRFLGATAILRSA